MYLISLFVYSIIGCVLSQSQYSSKYDEIDLESILNNDRLLRKYVDCLVGKDKCTPDGEELKKAIPEALENECAKCSDKHKEGVKMVIKHLTEHKHDWWNEIVDKFDPDRKYKTKYETLSKKEGITA